MREQTGSGGDVVMLEKEAVEETREQRVVHEAEAGAEEPGLTAADLVQTRDFLGEEGEVAKFEEGCQSCSKVRLRGVLAKAVKNQ